MNPTRYRPSSASRNLLVAGVAALGWAALAGVPASATTYQMSASESVAQKRAPADREIQIQTPVQTQPTLRQPIKPVPGPDLVITRTELFVGNPGQTGQKAGIPIYTHSRVLISLDVTNQGDAPADLSGIGCPVRLTTKPPNVSSCVNLAQKVIQPGQKSSGGIFFLEPNQLAPGTYPMTFTVDPDNKIAEKDETNNDAEISVRIRHSNLGTGLPDLVISRVIETTTPQNPCEVGEVEVSVLNQGKNFAYINTGFLLSKAHHFERYSSGIAVYILPGETYKARVKSTQPLPLVPGSYTTTFEVDPNNRLAESNEDNNKYIYNWTVQVLHARRLPDLVVTSVTFDPPSPTQQERVRITVNMKNQGQGSAYFCKGTSIWRSRTVSGQGPGGGGVHVADTPRVIAPGETFFGGVFVSSPGQYGPGSYQIEATVDPDNKVQESNTRNNSHTTTLVIR
jgi:hypothetical protein